MDKGSEDGLNLEALVTLWELRRPALDLLPGRQHFDIPDLKPWLGWINICDVVQGPTRRYRMRLIGSQVAEIEKGNNTGRFLDEVFPPNQYPTVQADYETAITTRQPVLSRRMVPTPGGIAHMLTKLVLPLASDGQRIDKFLVLLHFRLPGPHDPLS